MRNLLLRLLPLGAVMTVAALGLAAWSIGSLADRNAENRRALLALCALEDDLERRILTTEQFLEENPAGIPGVPLSTLEQSLANQRQTLAAIAPHLDCPS